MYAHSRTPVEDANVEAHFQAAKPLISNADKAPRVMSAAIMGEFLRARPGILESDLAKQFTAAEIARFLPEARDYAIRKSGDLH